MRPDPVPVPPVTRTPPNLTVQIGGSLVPPTVTLTPTAQASQISAIHPPVPITGATATPSSMTITPPDMTVSPPPVPVPATSVVVPASTVRRTPPPLSFTPPRPAPLQTNITTNIPVPTEQSISFTRFLDQWTLTDSAAGRFVSPDLDKKVFPIDGEVQDLPAGLPFIVQFAADQLSPPSIETTLVSTIVNIRSFSVTWGLFTGTTSIVTLEDSLETPPLSSANTTDIRTFLFHETLSPQLTLKAAPAETTTPIKGNNLLFLGTDAEAQSLKGRRLFFSPPGKEAFIASVTWVEPETSPSL